jgi:hypothetical protein
MDEVLFLFLILVLPSFLISFLLLFLLRYSTARERGFRILITSRRRSSATHRFFTRAISSPALPLKQDHVTSSGRSSVRNSCADCYLFNHLRRRYISSCSTLPWLCSSQYSKCITNVRPNPADLRSGEMYEISHQAGPLFRCGRLVGAPFLLCIRPLHTRRLH